MVTRHRSVGTWLGKVEIRASLIIRVGRWLKVNAVMACWGRGGKVRENGKTGLAHIQCVDVGGEVGVGVIVSSRLLVAVADPKDDNRGDDDSEDCPANRDAHNRGRLDRRGRRYGDGCEAGSNG